jgi:hypothetical protein
MPSMRFNTRFDTSHHGPPHPFTDARVVADSLTDIHNARVKCLFVVLSCLCQIEETALPFPQYALLHSVTCVQLRLITVLGNCGCVAVSSFVGVPSPLKN